MIPKFKSTLQATFLISRLINPNANLLFRCPTDMSTSLCSKPNYQPPFLHPFNPVNRSSVVWSDLAATPLKPHIDYANKSSKYAPNLMTSHQLYCFYSQSILASSVAHFPNSLFPSLFLFKARLSKVARMMFY